MIWIPAHVLAIIAVSLRHRRRKAAAVAVTFTLIHLLIGLVDLLCMYLSHIL